MAGTCFCGCGRRVRFGRKRASGHGAEVRRLLAILETVVVPMANSRGTPHQRAELARLIADGRTLERLFQSMAHGHPVAPPPISGISGWFQDANRVTRAFEWISASQQPSAGNDAFALPPFPPTTPDMDPTAVADARAMYEAGRAFFEQHSDPDKRVKADDAERGDS